MNYKMFFVTVLCFQMASGMRSPREFSAYQLSSLKVISSEEVEAKRDFTQLKLNCITKQSYFVDIFKKSQENDELIWYGSAGLTAGTVVRIIKAHFAKSNRVQGVAMECFYRSKGAQKQKQKALLEVSPQCISSLETLWSTQLLVDSPCASEEEDADNKVLPSAIFLKRTYYHVPTVSAYMVIDKKYTTLAFVVWSGSCLQVKLQKQDIPDFKTHTFIKVKDANNNAVIFWIFSKEIFEKQFGPAYSKTDRPLQVMTFDRLWSLVEKY